MNTHVDRLDVQIIITSSTHVWLTACCQDDVSWQMIAPQKEKNLPKTTKARKNVPQILQLQFVFEKTSRREDICLQTLTSNFFCQLPNKRSLVDTLIAIGNVIDISSVYFLLLNTDVFTFSAEMLLEAICFFVFAITVARSNQMKEDHWLSWCWIYLLLCNNLFPCQGKHIWNYNTF